MWYRRRNGTACKAIVGLALAVAFGLTATAVPATAQSIFDFLFGGFRRHPPRVHVRPPDDGFGTPFREGRHRRSARTADNPHSGFCVRLCDGRYFPVERRGDASAAEQCNSFCPASRTKVFSGEGIDDATAADGQHYADLPNSFLYRKRLVAGCTCNGKSPVGLASVPVADDPTLQRGDIVATSSGLKAYNGKDPHRERAYTPIASAKIPRSVRRQLTDVKVSPRPPSLDTAAQANPQDHAANGADSTRRFSAR